MKSPAPLEVVVQTSIIAGLRACFRPIDIRAVPNATGWLSKAQRAKLKREGRTKGTLDLIVAWPGGDGFLEIKRPGYTPSDVTTEQRELIDLWGSWGRNVGIASTIAEAVAVVTAWGAPSRVHVEGAEMTGNDAVEIFGGFD